MQAEVSAHSILGTFIEIMDAQALIARQVIDIMGREIIAGQVFEPFIRRASGFYGHSAASVLGLQSIMR